MIRLLLLVIILFSIWGCEERNKNFACKCISEAIDKRSGQIQTYLNDSNFYRQRLTYEKGLALRSIRDSIHGMELRLWFDSGLAPKQLYRLRCSNSGEWVGEKYTYRYLKNSSGPYTEGSGQIISKSKEQWEAFLDRVFKNGLLEFPDYHSVPPKAPLSTDETSFVCEAACGNKYFFYRFVFPYYDNDSIPSKIDRVDRDFDSTFSH